MGKLTMPRIHRITNMKMMINFNTNHTYSTSTLREVTHKMRSFHRAINMGMRLAVENMNNNNSTNSTMRHRSNITSNSMRVQVIKMTICGDNEVELWVVFPLLSLEILHFSLAWSVWRVWIAFPFFLAETFARIDVVSCRL